MLMSTTARKKRKESKEKASHYKIWKKVHRPLRALLAKLKPSKKSNEHTTCKRILENAEREKNNRKKDESDSLIVS
eukprot:23753_6